MSPRDAWGLVHLDPAATEAIRTAARRAHPLETGGALLGYRRDRAVLITDAIVISDPDATPASYTGRGRMIQNALDHILPTLPEGTGYVGPWHTHPARLGHSGRDRRALRRIAGQYSDPIASIVAKKMAKEYEFDVVVAQVGRRARSARLVVEEVPAFENEI